MSHRTNTLSLAKTVVMTAAVARVKPCVNAQNRQKDAGFIGVESGYDA